VDWSDGSIENTRSITNVTTDMNLTANFTKIEYTVTFTAGTGGSISGTTSQTVLCGGNSIEVNAIPDTANSYQFSDWSDGSTQNPRTVTNVTSDINLTANFTKHYIINFTAGIGGALIGTDRQTVPQGDDCTEVTAVAGNCYEFMGWSDGSSENTRTLTNVTSNMDFTANFAQINYTVTFTGTGGSLTGTTTQTVACGNECTQVVVADYAYYRFVGWSGDHSGTEKSLTITNVTSNMDITAIFEIIYPNGTMNATEYTVTVWGISLESYMFKVDNGDWSAATDKGESITFIADAEGEHTLYVIGKVAEGNRQAEEFATTATWTVDTTPPEATIANHPRGTIGTTSINVTIGGADVQFYKYRMDDGPWSDAFSIDKPLQIDDLEAVDHTLYVIGGDTAGNWQELTEAATVTWAIDLTVPTAAYQRQSC